MEYLRFPMGTFDLPADTSADARVKWVVDVASLPQQIREATVGLSDEQLDTPYRDGGWTLRQVVHHVADSHMNAYVRFKLAATEDNPTIRPYEEHLWAELPEAKNEPIEMSLQLIETIHYRWVRHMKNMTADSDWARTFFHPGSQKTLPLSIIVAMYSWHGRHHLAHITTTKERLGWL